MLDQARLIRRARAVVLALVLAAPPAAAEPVKLVRPDQYRSRIVAPKKGRVLVVNFWATWCEPCREELPALTAASKAFASKDVAFVLISIDSPKKTPDVAKALAKDKVPFVCWQAKTHDPQDFIDAVDKGWSGAVPYTLVYDPSGAISSKLAGKQSESSFAEAIRRALAAKS